MSSRGVLLIALGRDPHDAIVQATLVQHLKVLGVSPQDVQVLHTAPRAGANGWFARIDGFETSNLLMRHVKLLSTLRRHLRQDCASVVYTRDVLIFSIASIARSLAGSSCAIIFDCRGDIAAEASLRGRSRLRVAVLNALQHNAWRRADRVLAVSSALASHISAVRAEGMVVVPNLQPDVLEPDAGRTSGKVVFTGGAQTWQDLDRMLNSLSSLSAFGVAVEVITRDPDTRARATELGLDTSYGDREHVLNRLRTATASWIVREHSEANLVASPVKLGEALSAGALIIGSRYTWERMSELVEDELAVLIEDFPAHNDLARLLRSESMSGPRARTKRVSVVRRRWTLKAHMSSLKWFYGLD